jgi:hypothetical protein
MPQRSHWWSADERCGRWGYLPLLPRFLTVETGCSREYPIPTLPTDSCQFHYSFPSRYAVTSRPFTRLRVLMRRPAFSSLGIRSRSVVMGRLSSCPTSVVDSAESSVSTTQSANAFSHSSRLIIFSLQLDRRSSRPMRGTGTPLPQILLQAMSSIPPGFYQDSTLGADSGTLHHPVESGVPQTAAQRFEHPRLSTRMGFSPANPESR